VLKSEDVDVVALAVQLGRLEVDVGRLQEQVDLLLAAIDKLLDRDKATFAQVNVLTEVVNTHSRAIDRLHRQTETGK